MISQLAPIMGFIGIKALSVKYLMMDLKGIVVAAERLAGLEPTNFAPAPSQPAEDAFKNDPAAT